MKQESIAIKTTAPSTEGLDIVDFLCKVYGTEFLNSIDEIKNRLSKQSDNECFWIVYNDCITCRYIDFVPDCFFIFKDVSDKFIQFDNFSDFKKYIKDMKEEKEDTKEENEDKVNNPKHYTSHPSGIECIEITRHYCFSIGNAIKYLWRAGLKTEKGMEDKEKEIQDLEKAIWYIKDRINHIKNARKIVRFTYKGYFEHPSGVDWENITYHL